MANKMLIDAAHPEETRVVVLRGNRVEEFDFETAQRKQLRGNIYLAKVTRVEPSLQAAFVEYGGNRHGFLAFSEIHPDYYQIPVADRQALIEADARAERDHDDDDEQGGRRRRGRGRENRRRRDHDDSVRSAPVAGDTHTEAAHPDAFPSSSGETPYDSAGLPTGEFSAGPSEQPEGESHPVPMTAEAANPPVPAEIASETFAPSPAQFDAPAPFEAAAEAAETPAHEASAETAHEASPEQAADAPQDAAHDDHVHENAQENGHENVHENGQENGHENGHDEEEEIVESVGGADALEEVPDRAPRYHRRPYKIQEVIKRRQVMLVQVVKEERGTKGAALTTYLSLAGRYCVLMPNTARGGGISRKITSAEDRKKLREIAEELDVPDGMGVILRTAGAARTRQEVKRDFEYLLRLWEQVRDLTLNSTAPTLVYEEGSLAKRSIRDLYSKDIEEIVVAGEQGYRDAKEFMRMLMPSHAKNVKLYADTQQPIFARYGIESQLDAMFSPTVQLKSGGYIVINQTEALVAIDVNSGRSTREHHIEDTALKTNCEAAEEVARQLRLRDLAGLIVIDFIDMDEKRNNRTVERRMKDALRNDRARIQVGRISHFGLLEMSRQRIRTSVLESSTDKCPHCGGTGHMRSVSSVALQLLRAIEEALLKGGTHNQIVRTRSEIAHYVLNNKRAHLVALEQRFHVSIAVNADATVGGQPGFIIERGEQVMTPEQAKTIAAQALAAAPVPVVEEEESDFIAEEVVDEDESIEERGTSEHDDASAQGDEQHSERHSSERHADDEQGDDAQPRDGVRRRRRRRRGGGGERPNGEQQPFAASHDDAAPGEMTGVPQEGEMPEHGDPAGFAPQPQDDANGEQRHRRRGRRGGRRNRRGREGSNQGNGNGEQFRSDFHRGDEPQDTFAPASGEYHPPQNEQPQGEQPHSEPSFAPPAPQEPVPQPAAQAEQEPPAAPAPEPRRRSTVREPAPVFSGDTVTPPAPPPPPAPDPVPVVTSASDDAAKPRRTGWWAKRLLGGDKT